jgi:aspartate racemase
MKTVGLLGGMKWESTGHYYRLINVGVSQQAGGTHSTKIFLGSFDFDEIERLRTVGQRAEAVALLSRAADSLNGAGADYLVICGNEMHSMADDMTTPSAASLLRITDAVGEALQQQGLRRVGLLGPGFFVSEALDQRRLAEQFNLETCLPETADQRVIDGIICDELAHGVINDTSRRTCLAVAQKLINQDLEGLILGCPELTLIITSEDVAVPVFDSLEVHAGVIVKRLTV